MHSAVERPSTPSLEDETILYRTKKLLEEFKLNTEGNFLALQEIFDDYINNDEGLVAINFCKILLCFDEDIPLTQELLDGIFDHDDHDNLHYIILGLEEAGLLKHENVRLSINFFDEDEILSNTVYLEPEKFTQEDFNRIISSSNLKAEEGSLEDNLTQSSERLRIPPLNSISSGEHPTEHILNIETQHEKQENKKNQSPIFFRSNSLPADGPNNKGSKRSREDTEEMDTVELKIKNLRLLR